MDSAIDYASSGPVTGKRWRLSLRRADSLAELLELRRWVLDCLSGATPLRSSIDSLALNSSREAWSYLLGVERCALPLAAALRDRALRANGALELSPGAADALRDAARVETSRVRSARAQLAQIELLARTHGLRAVVLKGHPALMHPACVDVSDVDLLLTPEHGQALAQKLEALGYRAGPVGDVQKHLASRVAPGLLPIEIHTRLTRTQQRDEVCAMLDRAIPLEDSSGVYRLAPRDHLWHVLHHAIVEHPARRGTVRDLLVIAAAVHLCSDDDLAKIAHDIARHPSVGVLRPALIQARTLRDPGELYDRFKREAAARFIVGRGAYVALWKRLPVAFDAAFLRLGEPGLGSPLTYLAGALPPPLTGSGAPPPVRFRAERALRTAGKLARRAAFLMLAAGIRSHVAWHTRRVLG